MSEDPGPGAYYAGTFPKKKRSVSSNSVMKEGKISDRVRSIVGMGDKQKYPAIPEKVRGLTDTKRE